MHRRILSVLIVFVAVATGCADDGEATTADPTTTTDPTTPTDAPTTRPTTTEAPTTSSVVTTTTRASATFPGDTWERVSPSEVGLTDEGAAAIGEFGDATGSGCVAVVRDGRLAVEWYADDWDASTDLENFSATKSVSATIVGIAQDRGLLDIDDPASDYIAEWIGTDSEAVTIRNLLSNDSGRFYEFDTDYVQMPTAPDRTAFAVGLDQQHEPGTHWEYNNSAIQTLEAVLDTAVDGSVEEFVQAELFEPLGMDVSYNLDQAGNIPTFFGLQAGCVDMARFGWMARHEGRWRDRQIVSADYMREATRSSQDLNPSYGFLWWTNHDGSWGAAPDDAFAALGLGDQVTLVMPSLDMVVVRIGDRRGTAGYEGSFLADLADLAVGALADDAP